MLDPVGVAGICEVAEQIQSLFAGRWPADHFVGSPQEPVEPPVHWLLQERQTWMKLVETEDRWPDVLVA